MSRGMAQNSASSLQKLGQLSLFAACPDASRRSSRAALSSSLEKARINGSNSRCLLFGREQVHDPNYSHKSKSRHYPFASCALERAKLQERGSLDRLTLQGRNALDRAKLQKRAGLKLPKKLVPFRPHGKNSPTGKAGVRASVRLGMGRSLGAGVWPKSLHFLYFLLALYLFGEYMRRT